MSEELAVSTNIIPELETVPCELTNEQAVAYLATVRRLKQVDIAKILGMSQPGVSFHLNNWRRRPENLRDTYNTYTQELSGLLMANSLEMARTFNPRKVPDQSKSVAIGVHLDKLRQIFGESSHNISHHVVVERRSEAQNRLDALAKKAGMSVEELTYKALEHASNKPNTE